MSPTETQAAPIWGPSSSSVYSPFNATLIHIQMPGASGLGRRRGWEASNPTDTFLAVVARAEHQSWRCPTSKPGGSLTSGFAGDIARLTPT
jgi:hypothetical protein